MNIIQKFVLVNRRITAFVSKPLTLDDDFALTVNELNHNSKRTLELGGADRPLLCKSLVTYYVGCDPDNSKDYTGLYHKMHIGQIESLEEKEFDLIFSQYVMEHVENAASMFHEQLKRLSNHGTIIHVYPLGLHPYSICSQLAELLNIKKFLISILRPESQSVTGYKTFYSLGNVFKLRRFLNSIDSIQYDLKFGYGASDYFGAIAPIGLIIELFNVTCRKFRLTLFASNVIVTIRRHEAKDI
jgi:hypothetical protein